jgi:hypothetical protein
MRGGEEAWELAEEGEVGVLKRDLVIVSKET